MTSLWSTRVHVSKAVTTKLIAWYLTSPSTSLGTTGALNAYGAMARNLAALEVDGWTGGALATQFVRAMPGSLAAAPTPSPRKR